MANQIIRNQGSPSKAIFNGRDVERQEAIFLPSYRQWFPVLQTSMHFCFRDGTVTRGSTLYCTCGSPAIVVTYDTYKSLQPTYVGNDAIVCHHLMQHGQHADGSHE